MLNNEYYALKEIPKYKLYTFSKIYSHLTEPNILKKLIQYDFVPKIISSFQDYDNIYLITTYYDGKTLDFFKNDNITEEQIKFASACTIQSLIYLREQKIIHRDIMMKNIIMDKKKYFNIIDFSFSLEYSEKSNRAKYLYTYNEVTPPEMMKLEEFDYNSDYYRLGSIIYYLIFKTYPYNVKLRNNITNIKVNYEDGYDWYNLEKKNLDSPFKLIKNGIKQVLCIKIYTTDNYLIRYKFNSKLNLYKILIKQFDYINANILNQIYLANRNLNNSIKY